MTRPDAVEVVLPLPITRPYTYRVPPALAERVVPGARVVVAVRRRRVIGLVARCDAGDDERPLSDIVAAPDPEPAVSAPLLALARWMADYYGAPLGLAVRTLLPGVLWQVTRPAGPAARAERVIVLTRSLPSLVERGRAFARAPKRRAAYEAIEALGGAAPARHLVGQLGVTAATIGALVRQGLARSELVTETRDPFAQLSSPPPPVLSDAQTRVLAGILEAPPDTPALLYGVTGSGKTLVYLELLRRLTAEGGGAILLVPEIALTPQTVARVRGVFGTEVAVLHSALSEGERADAWRALRRGERRIAVGPRSAVFAPVQSLRAIVVDEEHEGSYKHGAAPRYHARDAAETRARLEGARLILGSATPSLETLWRAERGTVRTFDLPERIGARPLPPVELVDLRAAPSVPEAAGFPWTETLDRAVRDAVAAGSRSFSC